MKKQLLTILLLMTAVLNAQESGETIDGTNTTETGVVTTEETIEVAPVETTEQEMTNTVVTNTESSNSLYVDTVGYTITNGDFLFASPNARFEVQGVDEQSGLRDILVSVDGSTYAIYKEPIGFSKEGEHSLSYQFIDRVGNVSYSKVFSLIVDATAPRVINLEFSPSTYYASGIEYVGPNTEMYFRTHDDMTGIAFIEYSQQDQEMARFTTNTTLLNLGITNTMPLTLSYKATDLVSNVSPVKTRTIFVDATAPTVDVFATAVEIDGVRYISSKDTITVEAYDDDTAVSNITYSINSNDYQAYDAEIGINLKEAGEYTILVKAMDVVGNESEVVEYKVNVDLLAPAGDVMYIGEARSTETTTNETSMTLEVSNTDSTMTTDEVSTDPMGTVDMTDTTANTQEMDTTVTDTENTVTPTTDEIPAGTAVEAMTTEETPVQ